MPEGVKDRSVKDDISKLIHHKGVSHEYLKTTTNVILSKDIISQTKSG